MLNRSRWKSAATLPATTVADAKERMKEEAFDLILLDVDLPDGSGYEFCSALKNNQGQPRVPVVFLTGKSSADDVLFGFLAGGTDYIVKPFHPEEFRARIEARLRSLQEMHKPKAASDWLFSGNLRFHLHRREAQADTGAGYEEIALTPSEFRLLCHFARHPGRTMSREQLLADVWGKRQNLSDRAVDVHICQLRKKIPPGPCRIEAIYGEGYRYTDGSEEPGK